MFDPALLDAPVFSALPRVTIRRILLVLAWLLVLYMAWQRFHHAVHEFDHADRPPSALRDSIRAAVPPAARKPLEVEMGNSGHALFELQRGNSGHAQIDFGGQWLMGRMVATGQGRHLYDRNRHWKVLRDGYPADRDPDTARLHGFPVAERPADSSADGHSAEDYRTDAENLMYWTMGNDQDSKRWGEAGEALASALGGGMGGNPFAAAATQDAARKALSPELIEELNRPATGGPLYPPVHGLLYAPLGLIADAQTAYFVLQIVGILATFVGGWAAQWMSRGRLAWPLCTTLLFLYPGYRPGLDLGQNPAISVAIVLVGWALVARGREYAGGAVWGLLAFKPVWGLAFVLVPLLMLRWRVVLAMGVVGCGLALATLPIVGVESWKHWLEIGQEASATYDTNKNWIELSRDLSGIPKRIFVDFDKPAEESRADRFPARLGWLLWGVVFVSTILVYWFRANRRQALGLGAGFLFLGAYHCCYRFMYYDVLLSAAAVLAMGAHPGLLFRTPTFKLMPAKPGPFARRVRLYGASVPLLIVALLLWNENGLMHLRPKVTVGAGYLAVDLADSTATAPARPLLRTPNLSATSDYLHPVDTVLLLGLWAWAGWRLIRDGDYPRSASSAAPMSGERISDSPTSTA